VDKREMEQIQTYLRGLLNPKIRIVARPRKTDSAEVYVGEEFIGVLSEDNEDGDRSFQFNMAILDTDLEEAAD
jgi:hypothetical protein